MNKRWLFVVLLFGFGWTGRAVAAEKFPLLYRVDHTPVSARIGPLPGQPIATLPDVRTVTTTAELGSLTSRELRTVQPEYRYHSLFTPNDPQFTLQWNLPDIHVPEAWDAKGTTPFFGTRNVIVAILDTGLAYENYGTAQALPDLDPSSVWTNASEIPGDGIDNDHDGLVDDVHGWNFVTNNAHPVDNNGHGTHITGIIAALANNGLATAGIADQVTVMPLKVLDDHGDGSTSTLAAAVRYAMNHGANIINLSLGGTEDDPLFHEAIIAAVQKGIIIIGAAGNEGQPQVSFPARYPEIISVGATQINNTRAAYANYGPTLDLVAPGGDLTPGVDLNGDHQPDGIPSQSCSDATCATFGIMYYAGTSQAAAHVSAAAALLASCGALPASIRSTLTVSAADLGLVGRDNEYGAGLLNVAGALSVAGCLANIPAAPGAIQAVAGSNAQQRVTSNWPVPYTRPVFSWPTLSGTIFDITWRFGTKLMTHQRQTTTTFTPLVHDEGVYTLSVATVDSIGRVSQPATFAYRYHKPVVVVSTGKRISLLATSLQTIRTLQPAVAGPAYQLSADVQQSNFGNRLLVASQPNGAIVTLLDSQGRPLQQLQPFGAAFKGRIATTTLRLANGTEQVVAATASHGASLVWYTSAGQVVGRSQVYAHDTNGLVLTAGDVNGDGNDELIVAQAHGPEIRIYSAQRQRLAILVPRGRGFVRGWSVASGDMNGDGAAEIFATPYQSTAVKKVLVLTPQGKEIGSWNITGQSKTTGINLQTVDFDGDGKSEILAAPMFGKLLVQRWSPNGKLLQQTSLASTAVNSLSRL